MTQIGRIAGLAAAVGIGLAIASGQAVAHADDKSAPDRPASSQHRSTVKPAATQKPAPPKPKPKPEPGTPSVTVEALLGSARRDTARADDTAGVDIAERISHAVKRSAPRRIAADPAEEAATPYGDIGQWMRQADGEISDWLGQKYGGRTLLEPVNVIVVDRTSTSAEQSTERVTAALAAAGFPAREVHSTGYSGSIDGHVYAQEPSGTNQAFSNCFYIFPNDHGRFFGPAPAPDGVGYVWSAALSREAVGLYDWSLTHVYVSFRQARDTLRDSLVRTGATDLGEVWLGNRVNSHSQFTGDHDGYAVVVAV
jgi:hypothetical protein